MREKPSKKTKLPLRTLQPVTLHVLTLCKTKSELLVKLPGRVLSQYSNIKWSVVFGWFSE